MDIEEKFTKIHSLLLGCYDEDYEESLGEALKELDNIRIQVLKSTSKNEEKTTNCLFDVNTVLHTKDGRKIGNAIIIGKDNKYNIIKTDYGNECKFTDDEIKECFHIAYSDLTDEEKQYMRETIGEHKHAVRIVDTAQ